MAPFDTQEAKLQQEKLLLPSSNEGQVSAFNKPPFLPSGYSGVAHHILHEGILAKALRLVNGNYY